MIASGQTNQSKSVPDLSVVIPVYNRGELLGKTLESVHAASEDLAVETIVVDDGSIRPVAETLSELGLKVDRLIRQENRGLLFARLVGLDAASGRTVLFLDSDDFVSPDKLRLHHDLMRRGEWDVTYTDAATVPLDETGKRLSEPTPQSRYADCSDSTELFINIQPAPHAPVFKTEFIRRAIATNAFPPQPAFNSVAEIWFYHKAAVMEAKVCRIPGPHAIVGQHQTGRLTDHWEKLGVAALSVMENFIADTPSGPLAERTRAAVSARAFDAWRRQPHGMPQSLQKRYLAVWRAARSATHEGEGTLLFRRLARLFGALPLAWVLRRVRNASYTKIQTMDTATLQELIRNNPPPKPLSDEPR
jgi:glycosyltransferase involved in cell wall biosynthesis